MCFRWNVLTKQLGWMLVFAFVTTVLSTSLALRFVPSAKAAFGASLPSLLTAIGLGAVAASAAPYIFTNVIGRVLPAHMFLPLLDAIDLPEHGLWLGLPWYTSVALPVVVFYPLAAMWIMSEQLLHGNSLQVRERPRFGRQSPSQPVAPHCSPCIASLPP